MKELKDRYIRFDWAIKRLLGKKSTSVCWRVFSRFFLERRLPSWSYWRARVINCHEDDKFNRVDIKALNDKGEIIIVKIQNIRKLYYLEQVLYGVAKTITEYISLGEDYLYHG